MKSYITESIKEDFLQSLKTIISYPSVLNEGENGTPFGQAIQDVLKKTLDLCQELGFKTYLDPQGYYGYAEVGEGDLLAILCHLDVVPAGDLTDWETPPFEASIRDGRIYVGVRRMIKDLLLQPFTQSKACLTKEFNSKNGFGSYLALMKKHFGVVWQDIMPLKSKPAWDLLLIHRSH